MDFLEQMIDSVVQQTYQNWELCLADGSDDKHSEVGEYCKNLAKNDTRIVYEQLDENKGISENTNYCIKMATGDYIGLFDHDDVLHPCALYENMKMICEKNADFLYSDEATFQNDDLTEIITYHFKPDFAIDNLRANNYICHFTVFARELVEQVGGFREEYNGSQDHDIILRLTSAAKCICHIPKILYFWRSHAASTSQDIYSKTYAIEAGQKAVRNSIEENGMHCEVESSPAFPTLYKIKYEVVGEPKVSIVIPNKDHLQDLLLCVDSILKKTSYSNYEIVIVENNSTSKEIFEYYKLIEQHEKVRVLRWEKEFNYSAINNFAVKQTDGDYVLLLNNDTEVLCEEWIQEMLMYAQREDVGAVGAKLYYSNGTIQHAGIIMGIGQDGVAGHSHAGEWGSSVGYMGRLYYAQDVIAVTGACLMVSRSKYDEVGGLNEELAVAYNDVDFCLKLWKKGYLNVFTPWAYLYHHESVSRGYEVGKDKKDRFQREVSVMKDIWKEELEKGDPFYNPNVSLVKPWGFGAGIKHSYEE